MWRTAGSPLTRILLLLSLSSLGMFSGVSIWPPHVVQERWRKKMVLPCQSSLPAAELPAAARTRLRSAALTQQALTSLWKERPGLCLVPDQSSGYHEAWAHWHSQQHTQEVGTSVCPAWVHRDSCAAGWFTHVLTGSTCMSSAVAHNCCGGCRAPPLPPVSSWAFKDAFHYTQGPEWFQ